MKKSLVALAALAVVGTASAQSSVTMFGIVDAGIASTSNKSEDKNVYLNPLLVNGGTPALADYYRYMNRGTVTKRQTGMVNSGHSSSRLGFRGTEDLGGGLAASFWLEAALGNDAGGAGGGVGGGATGFFNRRSTVSLSGNFGEVRLGRDYVPSFWNETVFDPFGTNGVGASLIHNTALNGIGGVMADPLYVRSNNSVQYFLPPNLGGFYGNLMYAFGENSSYSPGEATPPGVGVASGLVNQGSYSVNPRTGAIEFVPGATDSATRNNRYVGGRIGYAAGPLDVAFSYGTATVGSAYYAGTTTNMDSWNLGGSYDFGPVKLFANYRNSKQKTDATGYAGALLNDWEDYRGISNPSYKGWLLGATVPVGPGLIRVSYSAIKGDNDTHLSWNDVRDQLQNPYRCLTGAAVGCADDPKANQFALGYVHNLSKRTALYATVVRITNKNGAGLSATTNGLANGYATTSSALLAPNGTVIPGVGLTPKSSTGYDFGIRHTF